MANDEFFKTIKTKDKTEKLREKLIGLFDMLLKEDIPVEEKQKLAIIRSRIDIILK